MMLKTQKDIQDWALEREAFVYIYTLPAKLHGIAPRKNIIAAVKAIQDFELMGVYMKIALLLYSKAV